MGEGISWLFEARVKPGRRAELEKAIDELVRVADGEPGTLG
jgi:quinol monooxygenase YgiN